MYNIFKKNETFTISELPSEGYLSLPSDIWKPENAELKKTYELASQFRSFYYGCQLAYAYLVSEDEDIHTEYVNWLENGQDWSNLPLDQIFNRADVDYNTKTFLTNAKECIVSKNKSEFEKLITLREKN